MEIRFRVWDGGKMWYPSPNGNWGMGTSGDLSVIAHGEIKHRPDAVAMLSTGLKDKNGKEIWEGDIVHDCGDGHSSSLVVGIAAFLGFHYWLTQESGRDITYHVMGNKYENPELLEEVA